MTSLQGYIKASYDELVEEFGSPDYFVSRGLSCDTSLSDDKVETEWELYDDEHGMVTIYDWKEYDGGATSRSGQLYRWHIGGANRKAVELVSNRLNRNAWYA